MLYVVLSQEEVVHSDVPNVPNRKKSRSSAGAICGAFAPDVLKMGLHV